MAAPEAVAGRNDIAGREPSPAATLLQAAGPSQAPGAFAGCGAAASELFHRVSLEPVAGAQQFVVALHVPNVVARPNTVLPLRQYASRRQHLVQQLIDRTLRLEDR